MKWEHLCI